MKKLVQFSVVAAILVASVSPVFAQGGIDFKQERGSRRVQPTKNGVLGFDKSGIILSKPAGIGQYFTLAADVTTTSSAQAQTAWAFVVPAHKIAMMEVFAIGSQTATAYGALIRVPTTSNITNSGTGVGMIDTAGTQTRYLSRSVILYENNTSADVTLTPEIVRGAGSGNESTLKAGTAVNVVVLQ